MVFFFFFLNNPYHIGDFAPSPSGYTMRDVGENSEPPKKCFSVTGLLILPTVSVGASRES